MNQIINRSGDGKRVFVGVLLAVLSLLLLPATKISAKEEKLTFTIHSFLIEGNTILDKETLATGLKSFAGKGKTAEDVELARDAIEKLYHKLGYPTVLANIPEQTVDDGIIRIQIIESRIKRIHVVGNKYYTLDHIREKLPSLEPGNIIYLPKLREEFSDLNRTPDLKVSPTLIPGRELGVIDVELKVEDRLPLHGYIELNNKSQHNSSDLQLDAMLKYDNLWQKGHSIIAMFSTAPENTDESTGIGVSYQMPAPWQQNDMIMGYYIEADSESVSTEGFDIIGEGRVAGLGYMHPFPSMGGYQHFLTINVDWKDFNDDSETATGPIEYVPFSIGYASNQRDKDGSTQYNAKINFLIRDMFGNDMNEFQDKRSGSTGNYIYLVAGAERRQKLPKDWSLFMKLDGQLADQPLIAYEQYAAGGVSKVRGYKESELMADNALHSTIELFTPSLLKKNVLIPYLFYDCAWLATRESLPDEYGRTFIHGAGVGLTGRWKDIVMFKLDWGVALESTDDTSSGHQELHFKIQCQF